MDRQFPPEIIQLIVEASLDPYDLFDFDWSKVASRYATLENYSLLNWTWQGASAPSLHEVVIIDTERQASSFLDLLDAKGGIVGGVRDLRIRLDVADPSDIARILRCATGALNLSLLCGVVSVDDLAHLQQLRRLVTCSVELVGSPASASLSLHSLKRLELYKASISPSAAHFLTPSFLPQLRQLELHDVQDSVDSLVPQLKAISIEPTHNHSLSGAKSLQLLQFPDSNDDRLAVLSQLPSLPPFLSINYLAYEWDDEQEIIDALEDTIDVLQQLFESTKKGLRVILLPDYGIDARVKSLIKQLEGRAIRVVREEQNLDFNGAIRAMERILAEEKRAAGKQEEKTSAIGRRSN